MKRRSWQPQRARLFELLCGGPAGASFRIAKFEPFQEQAQFGRFHLDHCTLLPSRQSERPALESFSPQTEPRAILVQSLDQRFSPIEEHEQVP